MLAVWPSPAHADTFALSSPERDTQYPASLGQQRFWVLDRLDPGNPSLNVAVRWRLEGELSVAHIDKAFEHILARHETLRTSFVEADGEPIQVVQPIATLRVPSIDLTAMPEADAAEVLTPGCGATPTESSMQSSQRWRARVGGICRLPRSRMRPSCQS